MGLAMASVCSSTEYILRELHSNVAKDADHVFALGNTRPRGLSSWKSDD